MKYSENGFRPLYKNFCIYPINETMKEYLKDQPGIDDAEGVMVYGYVDHEEGNTVEVLAITKSEEGGKFSYANLSGEGRLFIRIAGLMDEEFTFVDYGNSHFYEKFKNKIDMLAQYDMSENMAKSRTLSFLDEFRFEKSMDDVKVILYKEGLKPEGVWARIEDLGKGAIWGTLLNEPEQDFGVKLGAPIAFAINETQDGNKHLVADFTPRKKYKAEELADGKMLKETLDAFNADKNKIKFFAVLELLRDSTVVVPFTKKGVDIMTSNHKGFYPAFSSPEEMWQYDDKVTKISMTFLEVIKKARADKKLEGIVVNAFTDAVVVPKSLFDMVEGLESRVE